MFIGDGLSGLEEVLREIFPGADFQHCVVHHMRNCLKVVRKRDREGLAEDIKKIFRAKNGEEAYENEGRVGKQISQCDKEHRKEFSLFNGIYEVS